MDNLDGDSFETYEDKWWICKKPCESEDEIEKKVKLCEAFLQNFKDISCLGFGSYGNVFKIIGEGGKPPRLVEKSYKVMGLPLAITLEVRILSLTGCEYIPKLLYSGFNEAGTWSVIMEYVNGGDLKYHMIENFFKDPPLLNPDEMSKAKQTILYQIALGLKFVHSHNLAHGDLKLENVGLTETGHVRLLDFGNTWDIQETLYAKRGTAIYEAPEVSRIKKAGLNVDMWSYGILAAWLIQGSHPFLAPAEIDIVKAIRHEPPKLDSTKMNDTTRNFILGFLEKNPADRNCDIVGHGYFKDVSMEPLFKPGEVDITVEPEEYPSYFHPLNMSILIKDALRIPTKKYFDSFMSSIVNNSSKDLELKRKNGGNPFLSSDLEIDLDENENEIVTARSHSPDATK